jgi:hypothetical protein
MCSNCYNGCVDVTSDKCVRYTGIDVPVLGIKTGDSLSYVEQALITFLSSTIDGTGIKIDIPTQTFCSDTYCTLVQSYLPTCGDITAVDLFVALIKSACDLQTQVDVINAEITTLNADYTVGCLTGVLPSSGTHNIVQAIITNLCALNTTVQALILNVSTNYVALADLNALIQAYLDSIAPGVQYFNRMVPNTAVEYYGTLANFDGTGAGLGSWVNIYICNGLNGTPDKRGMVGIGAIQGVPGGVLAAAVNPASDPAFNPNYTLGDTTIYGANKITLDATTIPSHTHLVTDPGHFHYTVQNKIVSGASVPVTSAFPMIQQWSVGGGGNSDYDLNSGDGTATLSPTNTKVTGISNQATGGGLAHNNKIPAVPCHYVMYIP